ncbi:MAG: hypothetical protein C5B46_04235, partial [Proteobacteria bacterium]
MQRLAAQTAAGTPLPQPVLFKRVLRHLAQTVALALAYGLLAWMSRIFALPGADVSPIWLPAGIALAGALMGGPALLAGIALGSLAEEVLQGTAPLLAVGIAVAVTFAAALGATALRRLGTVAATVEHPRHVLTLIAVGATVAPSVAAVSGVLLSIAGHIVSEDAAALAMVTWALGDGLGVLLLVPLILTWAPRITLFHDKHHPPAPRDPITAHRRIAQLSALQATICLAVFVAPPQALATPWLALATLPIAAIMSALLPMRWVAVMNFLLFCSSAATAARGIGPFTESAHAASYLGLTTYNVALCVTTLVVAAMALERNRMTGELTRSLERFRSLVGMSIDWYWEQDEQLRFTYVSPG